MGVIDVAKSAYNGVKDVVGDATDALGLDTKKAVLCLLNPNLKDTFSKITTIKDESGKETTQYALSELVSSANDLQKQLLSDTEKSLTKQIVDTASLKSGTELEGKSAKEAKKIIEKNKHFLPFEVQYNPSSIRLETVGGFQEYKMNVQNGLKFADEIKKLKSDTNTYMSFQLVFDDIKVGDAFMLETGSVLSNTVADTVSDVVKGTDKHSVQPQVDMLLAALAKDPTRQMIFFWSNMCFRGELTRIDARYTMFNTKGNAIRATVDMTLEQNAEIALFGFDESYWSKSFEKVFVETGSVGGSGVKAWAQKAMKSNNILNF